VKAFAAGAVALALLLTGCGGGSSSHTVDVRLEVTPRYGFVHFPNGSGAPVVADENDPLFFPGSGVPCELMTAAQAGRAGIAPPPTSARIVVKDGAGQTIATASAPLGGLGKVLSDPQTRELLCDMGLFPVSDVPEADIYEFIIEGVAGSVTVSKEELSSSGWEVDISVG
jgi:hypothetical protein